MKKHITYLLLLTSFTTQAQDFPKTIYQLFNLKEGGCSYAKSEEGEMAMEEAIEMEEVSLAPPPPPRGNQTMPSAEEKVLKSLEPFQAVIAGTKDLEYKNTVRLKSGKICFLQEGKWGVRDSDEKVLLRPKFDFIEADTFAGGFAGYVGEDGNYYDGESLQEQLPQNYYLIKAAEKGVYIIQSKEGYGIWSKGKLIIKTSYEAIGIGRNKNTYFFKIKESKNSASFVLLKDLRTRFPFPDYDTPRFSGTGYAYNDNNIFNLKEEKSLFCSSGFRVRMVDAERQIAAVRKNREKFYFLIDFEGNLLSEEAFYEVKPFNENGIGAASIPVTLEGQTRPSPRFGLLDKKGNWIIEPIYKNIVRKDPYWSVQSEDNKIGLMDDQGKFIIPLEQEFIYELEEDLYLTGTGRIKDTDAKILNIKTGKVEKEHLPYNSINTYRGCNGNYRIATKDRRELLLDENYQVVIPEYKRIFYGKDYIVGANFNVPEIGTQQHLYNCKGKQTFLKINGEKYDTFRDIKVVGDLTYVYFNDGTGYLIPKKGKAAPLNYHIQSIKPLGIANWYSIDAYGGKGAGIVDETGKVILPFDFQYMGLYQVQTESIGFTTKSNKVGMITKEGTLLNNRLYDAKYYMGFGLTRVEEGPKGNRKVGLIDKNGKYILPLKYDAVFIRGGILVGKLNEKEVFFDREGIEIK